MEFKRVFTREGQTPYSMFEYTKRTSTIRNPDGSILYEMKDVEVPKNWSQVATDILAQKYIRKKGVPQKRDGDFVRDENGNRVLGPERSIKEVAHRLAYCWMDWGLKHNYFNSEEDAKIFYDETAYMLINQMAAPNSPQWFNTGLAAVYGIKGESQGHYYCDPETGELKRSEDAYTRPQPHACAEYHTILYTNEGNKYIGEIVEQDRTDLKVFDGEKFVKIQATKYNGQKEVFRIKLKNGNYIDLTQDHLVLSSTKRKKEGGEYSWKYVKDIKVQDRLQQPLNLEIKEQNVFEEDLIKARLAGFIVGDGSVGIYDNLLRLEIITINQDEYTQVTKDIEAIFGEKSYWVNSFEAKNPEIDGKRIHLSGKKIERFVEEYELLNKAKTAKVPKKVLMGSPEEKREFLKGLFQADGSVRIRSDNQRNSGDICLTTISKQLAFEVLQLLNSIGIYCRINNSEDKRENRENQNQVIIAYGSARNQYAQQVGFLSQEKSSKLKLLNMLVTKSKSLPLIREEQIISIESQGIKKVYDIQTESSKFLGNGIVIHNCFIQSVKDDLVNEGGIFDLVTREARIFKYGSGTGTNFSTIRSSGENLSGGGKSSGLMSFLNIFDRAAGAIKSGGTTRRAAKMVCLNLDHPEIEEFIEWKVKEEQKVAALVSGSLSCKNHLKKIMKAAVDNNSVNIKDNSKLRKAIKVALNENVPLNYVQRVLQLVRQGKKEIDFVEMDTHYESEAYLTVAGQNSNNSIRIPNSFFEALRTNSTWDLVNRTDGKVAKQVDSSKLWDKINFSAWMSADPGVQYDTTINEWHTCPVDGRINGSNPCSEYMFLDDTACNLASINLLKFYDDENKTFRVDDYKHAVRIWTTILEISVLMAQFPSKEIAKRSYQYRTLGLGFANIGSLLMTMGIPYDSSKGRAIASSLSAIMGGESYATSAELAKFKGAFERYDANKEHMLRIIRNHKRAAYNVAPSEYEGLTVKPMGINSHDCPSYLVESAKSSWDKALELGQNYGYRNAQVTVIAPTGTIGLVMDCDTTGVEPDFALVKFKKLAGGGYFKIVNQSVPRALRALGYSEDEIRSIIKYAIGSSTLKGSPEINHETLKEKGFTDEKLSAVESSLPSSFELRFAFNKWSLGEDFLKELGFTDEQLNNPNLNLLEALGFSKSQIAKAEEYVCGTMTLEGAPGLKDEHIGIFDCANKCGKKGERFISYMGHIKMMAAVQPFISGAISKTINMDKDASIKDVSDAYMESWKYMIKAVALYRDGSKLSQPLNAAAEDEAELLSLKNAEDDIDETVDAKKMHEATVKNLKKKLPTKRSGFVQESRVGGQKVYLRTGEYEDGELGEIFLSTYKEGASYGALLNCFAVAVSKGLQHGVPLSEFVDTFTFTRFEPSGPVNGHPTIKNATSIIDYVFRVLGHEYLGRTDFLHVKTMESIDHKEDQTKKSVEKSEKQLRLNKVKPAENSKFLEAKAKGYSGEQCPSCDSMRLRRNGNCMVCDDCGATTGCS
ncbi:MAG: adenosylcobalamin-dependent ribonucleoside-diphosphate reductase [Candidatus Woesearchaeota archaeon]